MCIFTKYSPHFAIRDVVNDIADMVQRRWEGQEKNFGVSHVRVLIVLEVWLLQILTILRRWFCHKHVP